MTVETRQRRPRLDASPERVPDLLLILNSYGWHEQAACKDEPERTMFPSEELLDGRSPGSAAILLPLLLCARCPVRRQCLAEGLRHWGFSHGVMYVQKGQDVERRPKGESIAAVGVWGGTFELERRAVDHLPDGEAAELLEATFGKRLARYIAEFRRYRPRGLYARRVRALLAEMEKDAA